MKRYLSIMPLLFLLYISCQPEQKQEDEEEEVHLSKDDSLRKVEIDLYTDVMQIHDDIMPAMSEIMALNKQLNQKGEEITDGGRKKEVAELSQELEEANESMMNWMRNFNPNIENMSHQETLSYLNEEKRKIEKVKEEMILVQKKAKLFLEE